MDTSSSDILTSSRRRISTWRRVVLASITAMFSMLANGASVAHADTHAPCAFHGALTVRIDTVGEHGSVVYGAGSIAGCPLVMTATPESVTITVVLQRYA